MATVVYKSLLDLQPVQAKYQFYKDENLQTETAVYFEGYNVNSIKGLNNFQDIAFNKNTCFILTSAISLSSFFVPQTNTAIGNLPGTIKIQTRSDSSTYAQYVSSTNTFILTNTPDNNLTMFFIQPVSGSNLIELRQGEKYLQVDESYPYVVRLGNKLVDVSEIYKQRFSYFYENGLLALKTASLNGYNRYLAFCDDGVLRATGVVLNDTVINDYILSAVDVTDNNLTYNFIPTNNWVTYFLDFSSQTNNIDVDVCQSFNNTPVNFLVSFPYQEAITAGKTNINIANLKTGFTPAGGPPQIDNTYSKNIITTN